MASICLVFAGLVRYGRRAIGGVVFRTLDLNRRILQYLDPSSIERTALILKHIGKSTFDIGGPSGTTEINTDISQHIGNAPPQVKEGISLIKIKS